jgi:hypothetical protein
MDRRLSPAVILTSVLLTGVFSVGCGGGEGSSETGPVAVTAAAVESQLDPPAAPGSLAPNLALVGGEVVLSWLEPVVDGGHRLLVARYDGAAWTTPAVVAEGERFFANWADLPAVAEGGDGSLVAHWLAKVADATYAYSIFLARSVDGGASWTGLGRLNNDDTPTEHGFVSWVPEAGGVRAFWLDGREMESGGPMGLRTALVGDTVGAAELLDPRVCECCSTDAALSESGPVVVYRDRGESEIRDIALVRRQADGWAAPQPAAVDNWTIAGCPVNGPVIAAAADRAAVAWFTGADAAPRVQLAFSTDGGVTFGQPMVIDAAAPLGRVDLVLDDAGGAVVSWLASAEDSGSVRLRRAQPDGTLGEPIEIATTGASRASGFPRLARLADKLYLAWVDTTTEEGQRIRARVLPLSRF